MNSSVPAPCSVFATTAAASATALTPEPKRIQTPATAVAHYVTEFDLSPLKGGLDDAFHPAVRIIEAWCRRKVQQGTPAFATRVESCGEPNGPDAWAMHIQHREDGPEGYRRFWYIDVGFRTIQTAKYRVRVAVSHALDFDYVGWSPRLPEPSVPAFVVEWLIQPQLKIRSGALSLAAIAADRTNGGKPRERVHAMKAYPRNAAQLKQVIFDPNRGLPVVFISGDLNPVTFPLVPDDLQRRLLGTCYVVWAPPASGWGEAWHAHFPAGYACPMNSVKIYQPRVDVRRPFDSYRHRFFSEDEIRKNGGPDAFVTMIRDGFTRRMLVPYRGRVGNCDDVRLLRAEEDFKAHRSKLTSKEEELALYETEYPRLLDQKNTAEQLLAESEAERKHVADELASLRPHAEALTGELERMKREAAARSENSDHVALMRTFMEGKPPLISVLRAIAVLRPDAVQILPSAIKSAEDMRQFELVDEARDLLWRLVTAYRNALIGDNGGQEAWRVFGRDNIASGESDNLSKEGRRQRTFEYGGQNVVMEQHLKIGMKASDARTLRIYFHWDATARRIVIGHCGKHLPL